MSNALLFILVPIIGYICLWLLGIVLFLAYFRLFKIPLDMKHPVSMIKKLPSYLAVATVPVCSFVSFFITTKAVTSAFALTLPAVQLFWIGLVSLFVTVTLDILITVVGEKVDIRTFPVNLMYVLAWLVIIPAVILA